MTIEEIIKLCMHVYGVLMLAIGPVIIFTLVIRLRKSKEQADELVEHRLNTFIKESRRITQKVIVTGAASSDLYNLLDSVICFGRVFCKTPANQSKAISVAWYIYGKRNQLNVSPDGTDFTTELDKYPPL